MINFSADNDQMSDSEGEFTKASLGGLTHFPKNFTICGDYMTEGWLGNTVRAKLFTFVYGYGINYRTDWYIAIDQHHKNTKVHVFVGGFFSTFIDYIWFPLSWLHLCISKESGSGKVVLVVNGQVLVEEIYETAKSPVSSERPTITEQDSFRIDLGFTSMSHTVKFEHLGMVSNLNIFSSVLPTERMIAITGGEECGAPGDYRSWEEADWQLHSKARFMMVDVLEDFFPCKKESKVTTYSALFKSASSCMNHCQKIGGGRGPTIGTLEEWEWVFEQYRTITPNIIPYPYFWLAAQDSGKEGVWK